MDDLLAEFLSETVESLAALDVALVHLERVPGDRDALSRIFRLLHTIKGTCGFLGLPRLSRITHAAEDVVERVRDGALGADRRVITAVLAALDRIRAILDALAASGEEPPGDDAAALAALAALDDAAAVSAPPPVEPERTPLAESAQRTVRIGVDVLDNLMTLAGELVLARNQLLQLARGGRDERLAAPLQVLSSITAQLQDGVMKTRMQPVGQIWNKLPRLVRDLAQELGKRIELTTRGESTELDRQVLELIRDPLTHMVRNCADHGIEPAAQRLAAGKPDCGRISLDAWHDGGYVVVEIADDGAGLDYRRIRAHAAKVGLAGEAELALMSEASLGQLIFHPGFSTAERVTALSGRGVGMDVVRSNIERVGGVVAVRSQRGVGTTVTLRIPLTLAIVSALLVEAGGQRFAIPQIGVVELVQAVTGGETTGGGAERGAAPRIEHLDATPMLRLRDALLPLVDLANLLRLGEGAAVAGGAMCTVVVTAVGTTSLGIVVDRVFDTEEIVVKPVAPVLRHIPLYGGNTILGDGAVVMILDLNGIARAAGIEAAGTRAVSTTRASTAEDVAQLVFRLADGISRTVPLGVVARIEEIANERIEARGEGRFITYYRSFLMPLLAMPGFDVAAMPSRPAQHVLVFSNGGRSMGLLIDGTIDVVHAHLAIDLGSARPGVLGMALVGGRVCDVIDTGYWLTQGWQDWFTAPRDRRQQPRVLIVDDSAFFRHLLMPSLAASGYAVTALDDATRALRLRDEGVRFDAIVSDVEMPQMDGVAFARAVRDGGAWHGVPMVALSGGDRLDAAGAQNAGFDDYVRKFDRDGLVASLTRLLALPRAGLDDPKADRRMRREVERAA